MKVGGKSVARVPLQRRAGGVVAFSARDRLGPSIDNQLHLVLGGPRDLANAQVTTRSQTRPVVREEIRSPPIIQSRDQACALLLTIVCQCVCRAYPSFPEDGRPCARKATTDNTGCHCF